MKKITCAWLDGTTITRFQFGAAERFVVDSRTWFLRQKFLRDSDGLWNKGQNQGESEQKSYFFAPLWNNAFSPSPQAHKNVWLHEMITIRKIFFWSKNHDDTKEINYYYAVILLSDVFLHFEVIFRFKKWDKKFRKGWTNSWLKFRIKFFEISRTNFFSQDTIFSYFCFNSAFPRLRSYKAPFHILRYRTYGWSFDIFLTRRENSLECVRRSVSSRWHAAPYVRTSEIRVEWSSRSR